MLTPLIFSLAVARPNIVIIFTDDHARQAISAYGSQLTRTPNIDRLAKQGAIFDRFYTSNPICAPSRATLLTGKYSHVNGHKDNASRFDGRQTTFPQLLQASGYKTAWIGKWHLESEPTGFDHWEILPGQGQYYNPDFLNSAGRHTETGYTTDLITDKSLSWLSQNTKGPFCLVIGHKAPHRQWQPAIRHLRMFSDKNLPEPPSLKMDYASWNSPAAAARMRIDRDLREKTDLLVDFPPSRLTTEQLYDWERAIGPEDAKFKADSLAGRDPMRLHYQRYIKNYLRCIASVDESVGKVTDELKRLGLDKNTIVIYASDQGFFLGEFGWYDKRLFFEPSAGTPLIISAPDRMSRGRRVKNVAGNVDLAPTILDIAGLPIPADMSGKSLMPFVSQKPSKQADSFAYGHFYESDDPDHKAPKYVAIVGPWEKLIFYYERGQAEYFDLKTDPTEEKNLIDDPSRRKAIAALFDKLVGLQIKVNEAPEIVAATKSFGSRM